MSIATRKEREKEQRRADIVDAAERLIFARGYESVTMDDIAEEAELARATLYLYFKNKDEIYLAIATRGAKIFNEMLNEARKGSATGFEKVKRLILTFYQFYRDHRGYYLANWYSQMPRYEAGLSAMGEMKHIRSSNFRIVEDAISEGIRDGTIREGVNPAFHTLFWISSLQSVFNLTPSMEMHLRIREVGHPEIISYAIDMMLRSVEKP